LFGRPGADKLIKIVGMLVFPTHTIAAIALIAFNGTCCMKNELPNTFDNWQHDRFMHVQVINF
jgi:hypothetical protein